jgi:hypothetical protein
MKSSKYISILCMGGLLSLASCTDGFESDNKINGSFDDIVKEYDFQKYTTNFETIQLLCRISQRSFFLFNTHSGYYNSFQLSVCL